jgi:hypothetical protein
VSSPASFDDIALISACRTSRDETAAEGLCWRGEIGGCACLTSFSKGDFQWYRPFSPRLASTKRRD